MAAVVTPGEAVSASAVRSPVRTIGVILAGGKSARMGRNKALLPLPGRLPSATAETSLLDHIRALLQQSGCDAVLISGAEVGGIPDRVADAGPLAGVDSVLAGIAGDSSAADLRQQLLIVPVDMPALSGPLLRALLEAGAGTRSLHYDDWILPLLLPATPATAAAVATLLQADGSRSLRALLQVLDAGTLSAPASAAEQFRNLNTPSQWQEWCAQQQVAPVL